MTNLTGETRRIRLVLLAGASVFALSAVVLLVSPGLFVSLLALPSSPGLDWAMRMIAITLMALTGNMAAAAVFASDRSVVVAGTVMLLAAGSLGVLTLLVPAPPTWFGVLYAMVGCGFATAYVLTLTLWWRRPR